MSGNEKVHFEVFPLVDLHGPILIATGIVRVEFIQLALDYKPLNLGQGLPDDLVPNHVTEALKDVASDHTSVLHQYTRGFVIADHFFFRAMLAVLEVMKGSFGATTYVFRVTQG